MDRRSRESTGSVNDNPTTHQVGQVVGQAVLNTDAVGRTLYFHTGTHKTGSTALQAYLAANQQQAAALGVSYVFVDDADQTMGNGVYLFEQVHGRYLPDHQLDELLAFYFAGQATAVCSSEDFTRFTLQEWQQISHACQRLGVQARFVTFVRDIEPYYFSLHGQLLKSGESYSSFEEFCQHDQYFPILDSLKALLTVFGQPAMTVIHYESAIEQLDAAFWGVVGLPLGRFDNAYLKTTVNRSLTEYEETILSRVTEGSGRQYTLELSDFLLSQQPNLKPQKHFPPSVFGILNTRHAVDLHWLNQTFFSGSAVVKIHDQSPDTADNSLTDAQRQAIDRDVAQWCLTKLKVVQDSSIDYIALRLLAIDWQNAGNADVPDDFDPIAYLVLNKDVLKAAVPPYQHFIESGRHEQRPWKWPRG